MYAQTKRIIILLVDYISRRHLILYLFHGSSVRLRHFSPFFECGDGFIYNNRLETRRNLKLFVG
jgi:hypothetical protein